MPEEAMALMREINELNARMAELQKSVSEKTEALNHFLMGNAPIDNTASPDRQTPFGTGKEAVMCAVKFPKNSTVYTYKTTIKDLGVGELVAVPQNGRLAMAVVVGVDKKPVPVAQGNPVVSLREYDIQSSEVTKKMREDYYALQQEMKSPAFFRVGIPARPEVTDTYAVSVRFMGGTNQQEYTYLANTDGYKEGDLVMVPAGPFNLPKRAAVVKYVPFPEDDGTDYKKVYCLVRDYERMLDGLGSGQN